MFVWQFKKRKNREINQTSRDKGPNVCPGPPTEEKGPCKCNTELNHFCKIQFKDRTFVLQPLVT